MSFRSRLSLFFVLIVALPMVAVAVLGYQAARSATTGEADARLSAGLDTAISLYDERVLGAQSLARRIASDPGFSAALQSRDRARLQVEARRWVGAGGAEALEVLDAGGRTLVTVGGDPRVASGELGLRAADGADAGSLVVSTTSPAGYLAELRRLTGRDGALVGDDGRVLSATVALDGAPLPASGEAADVDVAGNELRAATADLPSGLEVSLVGPLDTGGLLSSRPAVVGALAGFFVIALFFVFVVLRALQGQVAAMLGAARRIGSGDFSQRLPAFGRDEMAGLATEFNKMSERLSEQMDELRRQRDELEGSVRRIGEAFASGLDREALLEIVAQTALGACGATYGRVALSAEDSPHADAGEVPTGKLRDAARAAEQKAARDGDLTDARREDAHALASPLHPVGEPGESLGVMTIARRGSAFSAAEREVFLYLVGQVAVSIENITLHEVVSEQAITDELTGLANSRRFHDLAAKEHARARRFEHPLSILMLDVDDFKAVNDTYGHIQGDEVLRAIGRVLTSESRGVDEPARYGGEEFIVALPETGREGALEVAERIRSQIESERIRRIEGGGKISVSASIGAASMPETADTLEGLIAAADAALYEAKRAGKNRTVFAAPPKRARRKRSSPASARRKAPKGRADTRRS